MALKYAHIKSKQVDFDISRGATYEYEFVELSSVQEARALLAKNWDAHVIRYERVKLELVSD